MGSCLAELGHHLAAAKRWSFSSKSSDPNSQSKSTDELLSHRDDPNQVCQMKDSPFYVFRASGQGLVEVVTRLVTEDESRLNGKDPKGLTCLHHAATRARINVIDLLLSRGADINAVDNEGNTPLHLASEKSKQEVVKHLLVNEADGNIRNNKQWAAIHVATLHNNAEIIKELAQFPKLVDVNLGGLNGNTALHLAATYNFPEACKALLESGCKIDQTCSNGFYAIHLAAKNASSRALEQLLEEGDILGYNHDQLLACCDREGNTPLHAAVNSGDLASVKICLKYEARIDVKQNDKATAFHLAASQGTFSIVKAMFEQHKAKNPEDYLQILHSRDALEMTPLHRAAMFDHPSVVRYLVEEGSDVNAQDCEQRSPLLLAAVRCGVSSIRVLLSSSVNVCVKDSEHRNLLHFMVMYSGSVLTDTELDTICAKGLHEKSVNLLNQKDVNGCTPLHVASKQGNLRFTELLISLGAIINVKNNEEQTPLHYAARYGRFNTVRRLLASDMGPNMINETDGGGLTALHIASMNGYAKVVQLLLHKGALLHKDFMGRTPLHLAASGGHTQTVGLLLAFHGNLLNQRDKENNSALHYAALANKPSTCELLLSFNCAYDDNDNDRSPLDIAIENGFADVAEGILQHDRWREVLDRQSSLYKCPLIGLIQTLPQVYKMVLDRCRQVAATDPGKSYGFMFYAVNLTAYSLFIGALTTVAAGLEPSVNGTRNLLSGDQNKSRADDDTEKIVLNLEPYKTRSAFTTIMMAYIIIFVVINIFKEILQIYEQRLTYVFDPVNYTEWTLYLTSVAFVFPLFFSDLSSVHWQCATVAVFLAWFNLLLYFQQLSAIGIYVVMFMRILSTVIRVLAVFSVLVIAFGLTFHILLFYDESAGFYNPFISTIHTVLAMLSGWEFREIYVIPFHKGVLPYTFLNFFFLILFVILMPILFVNLLIGLAVGDIEMILKDAKLKRLAMQVEYHTDLEERLPSWLLSRVDKLSITIYPNRPYAPGLIGKMLGAMKSMRTMLNSSAHMSDASDTIESRQAAANDELFEEIGKTKKRLRDVQTQLDKQYDLLRLMVQKMEIVSEADQFDEGEEREPLMTLMGSPTNGFFESANSLWHQDSMPSRRRHSHPRLPPKFW
uniref:Ion transport domain-containing protein n=1 Tax=Plectus sambesii TaxID=2011161 RepID=A0A914VC02_9BILA